MLSGIYCIERIETGQKYIGKGIDVKNRMLAPHFGCTFIDRAIKKYGKIAFKRYILEYCEIDKLIERENYYIDVLHTHTSEGGYNIMRGDKNTSEQKHTEESKKKISENMPDVKGEKNPNYGNRGEKNPLYGTHPSKETREKIRIANTGKIISKESREKQSKAQKRRKRSSKEMERLKNGVRSGIKNKNSLSKYYGVIKQIQKKNHTYIYWRFKIYLNGKLIQSRGFKTELEAAKAYNIFIVGNGINRPLNIIKENE